MGNELAVASLEQAQIRALNVDVQRQQAMDSVTFYASTIEGEVCSAIKEVEQLIPKIQKASQELQVAVAKATDEDCKNARVTIAKQFSKFVQLLAKTGIKGVAVEATCQSTTDGKHHFIVAFQQKHQSYGSDKLWLGTPDNKKTISVPVSKKLADLQEQHKAMVAQLSDAQKQLLQLGCQAQDISRLEREGKALVIKTEREQTEEGRKMIKMLENAAKEKCDAILKYTEGLAKSTKLLTSKK